MAGKSPEFDNQSYREKIPVVPIIDDGLVVMVGVDGGGNLHPNDFAGIYCLCPTLFRGQMKRER